MRSNNEIGVTNHALDRFIERWDFAGKHHSDRNKVRGAALMVIREIWHQAKYVSDNSAGVRFRNAEFDCEMIVHKRTLVTLYKIDAPRQQPENHSNTEIRLRSEQNNSRFRKKTGRK